MQLINALIHTNATQASSATLLVHPRIVKLQMLQQEPLAWMTINAPLLVISVYQAHVSQINVELIAIALINIVIFQVILALLS